MRSCSPCSGAKLSKKSKANLERAPLLHFTLEAKETKEVVITKEAGDNAQESGGYLGTKSPLQMADQGQDQDKVLTPEWMRTLVDGQHKEKGG